MDLIIVCADDSRVAARVTVNACRLGPVIDTFTSMKPAPLHLPELSTAAMAAPLVAYLDGGNNTASFDAAAMLSAAPEAVRQCYELACGRLDVPGFVTEVDIEIASMLADGAEVPPLIRGVQRIEALINNHGRLTPSAIRRAADAHAVTVIVMDGGERAIAAFNMNKPGNMGAPMIEAIHSSGGLRFGGKGFLEWMLTPHGDNGAPPQLPTVPDGRRQLIYVGSSDAESLRDPRNMGVNEPEFTFDCFLGDGMALVGGDDAARPGGAPLRILDVDAVFCYEPTELVYSRDAAWRSMAWKKAPVEDDDDE